jgi:hypothetical protein
MRVAGEQVRRLPAVKPSAGIVAAIAAFGKRNFPELLPSGGKS